MNITTTTFHNEKIPYYSIDALDNFCVEKNCAQKEFQNENKIKNIQNKNFVKTIFTTSKNQSWKFGNGNWQENYSDLAKIFSINKNDFCTTNQSHTNKIRVIKNQNRGEGVLEPTKILDYDGIVTNEKNLMLCSVEADCVPVYFFDYKNRVVAMAHSGWRGTSIEICKNLIETMCKEFSCKAKNIICAIGPCACKNCYEVGSELILEFEKNFKNHIEEIFIPIKNPRLKNLNSSDKNLSTKIFQNQNQAEQKYFLDLKSAIQITLLKSGIQEKNIFDVNLCTIECAECAESSSAQKSAESSSAQEIPGRESSPENQNQIKTLCSYRRTKSKISHMMTGIMLI